MSKEYKTSDLGFIAALATREVHPIRTEREERKINFIYDNRDNYITNMQSAYFQKEFATDAREYFNELNDVKNRIYMMQNDK